MTQVATYRMILSDFDKLLKEIDGADLTFYQDCKKRVDNIEKAKLMNAVLNILMPKVDKKNFWESLLHCTDQVIAGISGIDKTVVGIKDGLSFISESLHTIKNITDIEDDMINSIAMVMKLADTLEKMKKEGLDLSSDAAKKIFNEFATVVSECGDIPLIEAIKTYNTVSSNRIFDMILSKNKNQRAGLKSAGITTVSDFASTDPTPSTPRPGVPQVTNKTTFSTTENTVLTWNAASNSTKYGITVCCMAIC